MHSKKLRKGQAAMEFLMTYGWAILVVLVVIGALAYFGVLNPQKLLPKKCQLPTGLVCADHVLSVTTTNSRIVLNNGLGNDIRLLTINLSDDAGGLLYSCRGTAGTLPAIINPGNNYNHLFSQTPCAVPFNCCSGTALAGVRIKGTMNISYINLQTNMMQGVQGTLITDIQS